MDPQTVQVINEALKMLKTGDPQGRLNAIYQLDNLGVRHPKLLDHIQVVAEKDPDIDVREAALRTLERLKSLPADASSQLAPQASYPMAASSVLPLTPPVPDYSEAIYTLLREQNRLLTNIESCLFCSTQKEKDKLYFLRTHVIDINMSIGSMANFMLKWLIASIPVAIIVWFFVLIFGAILGGCTRTLF